MKKLFLFAALLLGGASMANAQIGKGHVMVGGNIANMDLTFNSHTSIDLTPKAAWFIQDGLAVGAYAKFGVDHTHGVDGNVYTYGVGPLARYFVGTEDIPAFRQTKLFLEANAGFEGMDNGISNSTTNGLGFGVGPGISYFITPTVGVEALLKYNGILGFGSSAYTNGLSFAIGFQVYLPSKKLIQEIKNF